MEDSIHEVENENINQRGTESRALRSLSADRLLEKLSRPELATLYTDLKAYGERALKEPMPSLSFRLYRQFSDMGERKAYEEAYFDRRGRLAAVAMLALDTARPDALQALEEMLWDVCGEYTWCLPAHLGTGEINQVNGNIDLFAAETVHMLAEIVNIHTERLDRLVIERVRSEAERRIFIPLYREQRKFHWQTADHNWSAVCGGCCGMAALLLLEDEFTLQESISHTVSCMNAFLSGYGEDGGCAEGIGYWVYGFGYFTYYAEMLREYSEGELNLLTGSKITAIAAFPLRVHLSGGTYVNYSDSSEQEEIPSGLLSLLASRVGLQVDLPLHIPLLTYDPCHRWAHLLRNVMWSDPAVYGDEGASAQAERGFIFQNLGWMIAKGSLDSPDTKRTNSTPLHVAISIKGGHNDEPHNHNDLGQFIIHCGGENILCDPGAGLYTQAYFAPGREQLFHISSSGHNVPLIEGQEQSSGRQAQAHVLEAKLAEDGGELNTTLDLTSAYSGAVSLARYTRQFHWKMASGGSRNGAELRLIDCFQWKNRMVSSADRSSSVDNSDSHAEFSSVVERWMSRVQPEVVKSGNLRWQGVHGTVHMTYDANQWQVLTEAIDTVDHDNVPVKFYRTSLSWTGVINETDVRIESSDLIETVCEVHFSIEPKNGRNRGEHT
ncbi:heparinase II/III family protein [Paenibacillus sp. PK1-4R]|uniref:heparinase II/III domain-containing protein n=1 Tax=Paenibacillus sp. PK1-4R TaxID=3049075 RepID=UPI0025A09DFA|nr:heparinase II/III family protein [Paenibacillus sp. PK1-4R]WJM08727.1 heparinase II/III family protein [Paenibacillus sp. PK1-4R]